MVTDLSLPGVSGDDWAGRRFGRRPELRIVFASGTVTQPKLDGAAGKATLLRKPYDERAMLNALEAVMGGGQKTGA